MKKSAGIVLYRKIDQQLQIMLVHPGGPIWKNKDAGSWSIPKGEFTANEDPLDAAKREFNEETGLDCKGDFTELSPIKLRSGKTVYAWALEMDMETDNIKSNLFEMEWPPKSGKKQQFPEIDKAKWFSAAEAIQKINAAQVAFIDELVGLLK